MKRGVVLTVATPDYAKRWQFCMKSQRDYCARHGYEYAVHSEALEGLHPKWSKLQFTLDALASGVPVLLIDADAEIVRNAPPFHLMLDAYEGDILFTKGASKRLNSGVMIFRAGAESLAADYLQAALDRRHEPVAEEHFVTAEGENGHLIAIIAEPRYSDRASVIGREWNGTTPELYPFAYVRHYTGPLRQAALRGDLKPRPKGFRRSGSLQTRLLHKIRRLLRSR